MYKGEGNRKLPSPFLFTKFPEKEEVICWMVSQVCRSRDYFWMVQVGEIPSTRTEGDSEPEPVEVTASLSVDDLGEFSMGPLSISLPPQGPAGGSPGQSGSDSSRLSPGFYCASLSYDNIDYKKNNNKAFMDFTLNASPGKAVPEDNEDDSCDCDPCDCDCECSSSEGNNSGVSPGGSGSSPSRRSTWKESRWASSSGGKKVVATANKKQYALAG